MSDKTKGLFGPNISTQMREDLSWQAIYLLDLFHGIWRKPGAKLHVSNNRLAEEFGFSVSTVKRALKLLEEKGYIRREIKSHYEREILPGGCVTHGEKQEGVGHQRARGWVTPEPGGGSPVDQGWLTSGPLKTYKYKTYKSKNRKRAFYAKDPDTNQKVKTPSTFLTLEQLRNLRKIFRRRTKLGTAEFCYWLWQMHCYRNKAESAWKKYKDHSLVIQSWRRRALGEGKEFNLIGPNGPDYYKPYVIENYMRGGY